MYIIDDPDVLLGSVFNSFEKGFSFVLNDVKWTVASKGKKRILLKSDKGNVTIHHHGRWFYGNTKYDNFWITFNNIISFMNFRICINMH